MSNSESYARDLALLERFKQQSIDAIGVADWADSVERRKPKKSYAPRPVEVLPVEALPVEALPVEPVNDEQPPSKEAAQKGDPASRRWLLTLPEAEYSQAEVESRLAKYRYVVGQLEVGEASGYRHWQLYLEAKTAVRRSRLSKLFPCGHFEKAKYPRINCVRYVTKAETSAGVTISIGEVDLRVKQGKRTDLDSYLEQIMLEGKSAEEVIYDDPRAVVYATHLGKLELIRDRKVWGSRFREMEVHYIHGTTRTGKTSAIRETYGDAGICRVSNWKNPFDEYRGQDVLVLDEYNTSVPIVDLLKILEGYPLTVSARYYDKIAKFTKVFILSNLPVEEQHLKIQEEHPQQWAAFKARLTSVSEMFRDGRLVVASGEPPALEHFLTKKPVEVVQAAAVEASAVSEFDDDFGSAASESLGFDPAEFEDLFGDDVAQL